MATTTLGGNTERVDGKKIVRATLIGAVLAAVVNAVLWAIMRLVLALPMVIQMGGPASPTQPLGIVPVVVATIIPAIGAGVLLALLGRFTRRPYTIFLILSAVFLLLSFLSPLSLPGDLPVKLAFEVLHIGAAAAIVWALVTQTRAS